MNPYPTHQSTPINFFNYGLWLRIWDSSLPCSNVNKANWTWSFLPLHDLPSVMLIAFSAPYLDLNLKMQSIYSIQSSSLWVWWKPIHDLHSWAWPPILLSCFLHVGCEKEIEFSLRSCSFSVNCSLQSFSFPSAHSFSNMLPVLIPIKVKKFYRQ